MSRCIELEDFELLGFFGVEPETMDEDIHWFYSTHVYDMTRDNWRVVVTLSPAYRSIHLQIYHSNVLVCELESKRFHDLYLFEHDHRQWLVVEISEQSTCSLRLDPQPMLQWNHEDI